MRRFLIVSLSLCAVNGFAQASAQSVKVNGFIDVYYAHNFARSGRGLTLNGRGFDVRNDEANLSFAEIDFAKPVTKNELGFTAMFYAGRSPDIIHVAEPGGKDYTKWIRQAFVTYQTNGSKPWTIDFGKYDTWIGYEGIDTRYQDQYSRSFNWTYSETTYETGLRASTALTNKLNGAFYVVQGWNEVKDANDGKSWGITLTYSPDSATTYTLQNHSGTEGSTRANDAGSFGGIAFPKAGTSRVDLIDFIASHQLCSKVKAAFNVDYGNSNDVPNKGKWNGEVLYLKDQLSNYQAGSLRFERFEDNDGLRTGAPVKLYSATGGYDHTFTPNLTLRLELRHDISDNAFFLGRNGSLDRNRTTVTVAAIGKF